MKGLAELTAENDAIVERARKREANSIKRLKQRINRVMRGSEHRWYRSAAFQAIDAWHVAERKRDGR